MITLGWEITGKLVRCNLAMQLAVSKRSSDTSQLINGLATRQVIKEKGCADCCCGKARLLLAICHDRNGCINC
jgi:hypothetical protein